MTIKAIGKFDGVFYDGFKIDEQKIDSILMKIKQDIEEDNKEEDERITVNRVELNHGPTVYGVNGQGILEIDITILTCLARVKVRTYDYSWDSIILADYQNKYDYTYDENFFHIARNDSV